MSPASIAKPHHEPEENEFLPGLDDDEDAYGRLLQSLLNQIEDGLKRAIEHDLTGELRQVLAKFPELQVSVTPAPTTPTLRPDFDTIIGLTNAAYLLDDHARRAKPDSANQKANANVAAFLKSLVDQLKGAAR